MADPHTNPAPDTSRARADGPPAGQTSQAKTRPTPTAAASARAPSRAASIRPAAASAAASLTQAAQPLVEGGRQLAEQSRRAGRQVADTWRQAVDPFLAMQFELSQWFDDVFRHTLGFRHGPATHPFRPVGLSAVSLFGLPPAD